MNNYLPKFRIFKKSNNKSVYNFRSQNHNTAYKEFSQYVEKTLHANLNDYYFEMVHEWFDSKGVAHEEPLIKSFLKDAHEETEEQYNRDCRPFDKIDIENFKKIMNDDISSKYTECVAMMEKDVDEYDIVIDNIKSLLSNIDLNTAPRSKMEEIKNLIDKAYDLKDKIENYISMIKEKHQTNEWWDITFHILDDLKYNLPILIKKAHSYPAFMSELPEAKEKKPWILWKEELKKLLLNINLYKYYDQSGIIDKNDKQMVKIHKEYKNTLPYHKGTKKDLDYMALRELANKHWEFIWDWLKEYGTHLWD